MKCLRIGATDIKYIKKLADTLKDHPNADPNLRAETEKFLSEISTLVASKMAHDSCQPELAREKAIDLILKLQR